jgi:hypothetical protein
MKRRIMVMIASTIRPINNGFEMSVVSMMID